MAEPSNLLGPSVVPLLARSIGLVGYYIWSASVWGSMILRLKQLEHRKLLGKEILRCDWQRGTYANSWILIDLSLSLSPTSSPKSLVFFGDYHFSAEYHFLWIINNNHPKSSARVNEFGLIFAYLIIFVQTVSWSKVRVTSEKAIMVWLQPLQLVRATTSQRLPKPLKFITNCFSLEWPAVTLALQDMNCHLSALELIDCIPLPKMVH